MNDQRVQITETGSEDVTLRMCGQDFSEPTSDMILYAKWSPVDLTYARSLNQNDRKYLKIINDESCITNEHNILPLPGRDPNVHIPYNQVQVHSGLNLRPVTPNMSCRELLQTITLKY